MNPEDRLFGQVAIKLGFMTREAASHCLKVQTTERQGLRLGQVARELKLLNEQQFVQTEQHVQSILEQRRAAPAESKRTPDAPPVSSVAPSLGNESMLTAAHKVVPTTPPAWAVPLPPLTPSAAPEPLQTHS